MLKNQTKKTRRGRKENPKKELFFKTVKSVSIYMPRGYAIVISEKLNVSRERVYNVVKCRTIDENILAEMKKIKEQAFG